MHRDRILRIARAALPEERRRYTGHVIRWRELPLCCPNCNSTDARKVSAMQLMTLDGELWDGGVRSHADTTPGKLVVVSCAACETFTAMEVRS